MTRWSPLLLRLPCAQIDIAAASAAAACVCATPPSTSLPPPTVFFTANGGAFVLTINCQTHHEVHYCCPPLDSPPREKLKQNEGKFNELTRPAHVARQAGRQENAWKTHCKLTVNFNWQTFSGSVSSDFAQIFTNFVWFEAKPQSEQTRKERKTSADPFLSL